MSSDLTSGADETLVNFFTGGYQKLPSVVVLADGGYLVTWYSDAASGATYDPHYGIYGRLFNSSSDSTAEDFKIYPQGPAGHQISPCATS